MTYRSITVDGQEVEFTEGFTDLPHPDLRGGPGRPGFGIADARPSIELAYRIRTVALDPRPASLHPFLNPR
jgi:UDP-N-acetyl-2-amino-2-deoxyglucuronate dehydrogenase